MPASPARATKFTGAARWASGQKCELRRHASASKVRFKVRVVRKLYGMSCCSDAGQQGLSVVWTSFKMIGPSAPPGGHLRHTSAASRSQLFDVLVHLFVPFLPFSFGTRYVMPSLMITLMPNRGHGHA